MSIIFVSHSSKDEVFTKRLNDSLKYNFGVETWVFSENNLGAMTWDVGVETALEECSIMVLVVSPDAMASDNVAYEWKCFLDSKKPIIPVVWKPIEKWNYRLKDWLRVVFHDEDYNTAFQKLCEFLQQAGVQPSQPSVKINRQKTGNLFWLCHDLMELHRWLLSPVPKLWLDIGFRQSHHHANELGLDETVVSHIRTLRDNTDVLQEDDWTPERREQFANEVRLVFNTVAQIAQAADPDFDPGPG